tara:strand:+ start:364 stop:747 length:384 start_codon:yes stop_codon:yes gene_type:complete
MPEANNSAKAGPTQLSFFQAIFANMKETPDVRANPNLCSWMLISKHQVHWVTFRNSWLQLSQHRSNSLRTDPTRTSQRRWISGAEGCNRASCEEKFYQEHDRQRHQSVSFERLKVDPNEGQKQECRR